MMIRHLIQFSRQCQKEVSFDHEISQLKSRWNWLAWFIAQTNLEIMKIMKNEKLLNYRINVELFLNT